MKTSILICLVTSLVLIRPANSQETPELPDDKTEFHLFLLAGQSNMAGRGKIADEDLLPHPSVLSLNQAGNWVAAVAPLHFDKPKIVGVGIGKTFGMDYVDANPGVTVGLIPCAVGGSPIAAWEPGVLYKETMQHPYDEASSRTLAALKVGTLKGILWHQGESDSNAKRSPEYQGKLHALIARFRADFDAPGIPFIAGQMGQFPKRVWTEHTKRVDQVHRHLPAQVANTGFVSSDRLAHRGDDVHFDSASLRKFGHRYFQVFQSVTQSPK